MYVRFTSAAGDTISITSDSRDRIMKLMEEQSRNGSWIVYKSEDDFGWVVIGTIHLRNDVATFEE